MANLKRAYQQLFARPTDERFATFDELYTHCLKFKDESEVHWKQPKDVFPVNTQGNLGLKLPADQAYELNDWSFGQVCAIAEVKKETVNRLRVETARQVLTETLPNGSRPLQVMTRHDTIRSVHGVSYTRLFDAELLDVVIDETSDFNPPPIGLNGGTGLYAGEQDMFAFLVDDQSWVDIGGEQYAPGFFIWNSEVGRRTVGIETFWYQRVCANHIVWDATEVVSYRRKHTANVVEAVEDIRLLLRRLVQIRDQRKDSFVKAMASAMETKLGSTKDEVSQILAGQGIGMSYVKAAVETMGKQSRQFTLFQAVDALTRLTGRLENAGDRAEQDVKIGRLLSLAI